MPKNMQRWRRTLGFASFMTSRFRFLIRNSIFFSEKKSMKGIFTLNAGDKFVFHDPQIKTNCRMIYEYFMMLFPSHQQIL